MTPLDLFLYTVAICGGVFSVILVVSTLVFIMFLIANNHVSKEVEKR